MCIYFVHRLIRIFIALSGKITRVQFVKGANCDLQKFTRFKKIDCGLTSHKTEPDSEPRELEEFELSSLVTLLKNRRGAKFIGLLITRRWLITAASFLIEEKAEDIRVKLESQPYITTITGSRIIIHPKYMTSNFRDHNLALLRISDTVNFTDTIKPICLPETSKLDLSYESTFGVSRSWRLANDNSIKMFPVHLERGHTNSTFKVNVSFCEYFRAGDPIIGINPKSGRQTLIGTYAGLIGCQKEESMSAVYSRMSSLSEWIYKSVALKPKIYPKKLFKYSFESSEINWNVVAVVSTILLLIVLVVIVLLFLHFVD